LRFRPLLTALALVAAGCGADTPSQPTPPPPPAASYTVSSITDGDTLRFSPGLQGNTVLRMLHLDSPELAQAPWGDQARAELQRLAPAATVLRIETEEMLIDPFGRILGHAIRSDGLDLNREQLRLGQGVLLVIWPNVGRFEDYRAAEIEAQDQGRGIWNPALPLTELPFEYRLRIDGGTPFRWVGDFFTRRYVDPRDYRRVHVNNRIFFNTTTDAASAGYLACARNGTGGDYEQSCFSPGR
jgi:endonuclease YncB( thermonuclease family)